ncbi:Protein UPSTREAM OF FLC [Camellia lanceoleosa]|uniref:Protein UPSTREAM OF FLC n=1 Tax=Camellia lanceoleosa TaxID=1840588 RepID=A0ACC0IK24_9ERIC|nr:Protein UPSTREAM OF FLC [Camellia lanceoleosa]
MEFSEEFKLMKKQMAKRRMEAAQAGSGGGGGGGGEVRRIHIIYFLSRRGRIEHPHLIRVRHLSRNGVRLRDVKRWLSELRGKDMPESFAWSYKRKYKTGYLWQDLLDEDLITPISDNEYVLKGSEIPSSNLDLLRSHGEKKDSIQKEHSSTYKTDARDTKSTSKQQNEHQQQHPQQTTIDVSTKTTSSEIEEESPPFGSETSTLTDDSLRLEQEKHSDSSKQETTKQDKFENSSLYSILLNKMNDQNKNKNNKNKNEKAVNPSTPASSTSTSSSSFSKSKSYSGGATNMFRSFIRCGAVDTNDSVMVMINRRDKKSSSCYEPIIKMHENSSISTDNSTAEICKEDKLGGSERVFGTPWINQQQPHPNARKSFDGVKSSNRNKSQFNNQQKSIPAAYKPINGPNCS